MSRGPAFVGFPNHVAEPYCTVSTSGLAGLVPPGFEASFLQTEEPTERARLTTLDPYHTWWSFDFAGLANDVLGAVLGNHNVQPSGAVRFLGSNGTAITPPVSRFSPNSLAASTNVTGALLNVDEQTDTPDGAVMEPTIKTSSWDVTLGWADPGAMRMEPGLSAFVVRVTRNEDVGLPGTTYPRCTASLYSGATLIASLGYRAVQSLTGQILVFPFTLGDVPQPITGSNLRLKLSFTAGMTTVPGLTTWATLGSAELLCEYPSAAITHDSGWLTVAFTTGPLIPVVNTDYFPTTVWDEVSSAVVWIRTDQAAHDPRARAVDGHIPKLSLSEPPQFVEAGIVCMGEGRFLGHGLRKGAGPGGQVIVAELAGVSAAGQSYGADAHRRRSFGPADLLVTREENTFLRHLPWRLGKSGAFYFATEPDIPYQHREFSSFWATLRDLGDAVHYGKYKPDGSMLVTTSISVEEKV